MVNHIIQVPIALKVILKNEYGYHYGYNFMSGKYEWYVGNYSETICDEHKTDTLEIKP